MLKTNLPVKDIKKKLKANELNKLRHLTSLLARNEWSNWFIQIMLHIPGTNEYAKQAEYSFKELDEKDWLYKLGFHKIHNFVQVPFSKKKAIQIVIKPKEFIKLSEEMEK